MPRVLVPLAEGFEELEAITITDLLTRAQVEVVTAGLKPGPVKASRGTVVVPTTDIDHAARMEFDMVVLPGGLPGANHLRDDPLILAIIKKMAKEGKIVAAICAAPKALAAAGVLNGRTATCYPGTLDAEQHPAIHLVDDVVVSDNNIVTSRGPGTAMDFSLSLIEKLVGKEIRDQVETGLQRPAAHIQH